MAILIRRKPRVQDWPPMRGLRPVEVEHFLPGERVFITHPGWLFHPTWKSGDIGSVVGYYPSTGMWDIQPRDDLYKVKLDSPITEKTEVYLKYSELERLGVFFS